MISLNRLNGRNIVINAEMIEYIEKTPDIIISLTNGKKIVVKDELAEIIDKVIEYKRKINTNLEN